MLAYYQGESAAVADLFTRAVHQLAGSAYSPAQLAAWAPQPVDYERWRIRCELKQPFLWKLDGELAGFLELDPDGHIDCHYTDPTFVRRGVATSLLRHAVEVAEQRSLPRLFVEASHLIRPVYERNGFQVIRPNQA